MLKNESESDSARTNTPLRYQNLAKRTQLIISEGFAKFIIRRTYVIDKTITLSRFAVVLFLIHSQLNGLFNLSTLVGALKNCFQTQNLCSNFASKISLINCRLSHERHLTRL